MRAVSYRSVVTARSTAYYVLTSFIAASSVNLLFRAPYMLPSLPSTVSLDVADRVAFAMIYRYITA